MQLFFAPRGNSLVDDSFTQLNQITTSNMGQAKSRSQNTEVVPQEQLVQFVVQLPKQDPIFSARGKLSDETDIKISTQTDGLFKNLFVWKEEFEYIEYLSVFVDRSFEMKTKTGEMIKIDVILSYDTPNIYFKVKIVQGANLFTKMKVLKFTYAHGSKKGYFGTGTTPNESELFEEEFERYGVPFIEFQVGRNKII